MTRQVESALAVLGKTRLGGSFLFLGGGKPGAGQGNAGMAALLPHALNDHPEQQQVECELVVHLTSFPSGDKPLEECRSEEEALTANDLVPPHQPYRQMRRKRFDPILQAG
jgi:hypothetical protein